MSVSPLEGHRGLAEGMDAHSRRNLHDGRCYGLKPYRKRG